MSGAAMAGDLMGEQRWRRPWPGSDREREVPESSTRLWLPSPKLFGFLIFLVQVVSWGFGCASG